MVLLKTLHSYTALIVNDKAQVNPCGLL